MLQGFRDVQGVGFRALLGWVVVPVGPKRIGVALTVETYNVFKKNKILTECL